MLKSFIYKSLLHFLLDAVEILSQHRDLLLIIINDRAMVTLETESHTLTRELETSDRATIRFSLVPEARNCPTLSLVGESKHAAWNHHNEKVTKFFQLNLLFLLQTIEIYITYSRNSGHPERLCKSIPGWPDLHHPRLAFFRGLKCSPQRVWFTNHSGGKRNGDKQH